MAKKFVSYSDATRAAYLYFEDDVPVHDITSEFGVNTFRLYEVVDAEAWLGAKEEALSLLQRENPIAWGKVPKVPKPRRGMFGRSVTPMPLFD